MKPAIRTFTGKEFYPLAPDPSLIDIRDIAHALSQTCRFTGHCSRFYSVAEHSLTVSRELPIELALWGLLHDASEAYLVDLARPLKHLFPDFVAAEKRLMEAVCTRFGLPIDEPNEVKVVDARCLVTEARDLMGADWSHLGRAYRCPIYKYGHPYTFFEAQFLDEFQRLYTGEV